MSHDDDIRAWHDEEVAARLEAENKRLKVDLRDSTAQLALDEDQTQRLLKVVEAAPLMLALLNGEEMSKCEECTGEPCDVPAWPWGEDCIAASCLRERLTAALADWKGEG